MNRPGLGRLHAPDPRDEGFPLRRIMPPGMPPMRKVWRGGPVLNQGQTPECVAYAWKQWLDSAPHMDKTGAPPSADDLYAAAQKVDEWAGTPHEGTSVRAGAKVLQADVRIASYHWSTSAQDAADYILTTSPVVFGTDWHDSMFTPESSGFLRVKGPVVGGHAYLGLGYDVARGAFRCINSWGTGWGQRGRFWISGEDMQKLLDADGEACAALEA
jgi:hypothetical protein